MRLLPITESSWRTIRAQWKRRVEGAGEDFSTYALTAFASLDPGSPDPGKSGLYALYDGEEVHAFCQVNRLLMSRFPSPVLRARLVTVSPIYDLGQENPEGYAQTLVALFSGVIWLSRETLSSDHIRFLLRSPGDAQFFAALQIATPLSPFSEFAIHGAWITCSLKRAAMP
jgi:hypothetical protein